MTKRKTAGDRLRDRLNEALKYSAKRAGKSLEWSHIELVSIDRACDTADRAEQVRERFDKLIDDPEAPPSLILQASAELRLLDRTVVDLVGKISPEAPIGRR